MYGQLLAKLTYYDLLLPRLLKKGMSMKNTFKYLGGIILASTLLFSNLYAGAPIPILTCPTTERPLGQQKLDVGEQLKNFISEDILEGFLERMDGEFSIELRSSLITGSGTGCSSTRHIALEFSIDANKIEALVSPKSSEVSALVVINWLENTKIRTMIKQLKITRPFSASWYSNFYIEPSSSLYTHLLEGQFITITIKDLPLWFAHGQQFEFNDRSFE